MNCARCNTPRPDGGAGGRLMETLIVNDDGRSTNPWVCEDCGSQNGIRWCPGCKAAYIGPNREWYTNTPPRSVVPCPEHSTNPDTPTANCEACDTPITRDFRVDNRSRLMCQNCLGQSGTCRMAYCNSHVHPELDNEHTHQANRPRDWGRPDELFQLRPDGTVRRPTVTHRYCSADCLTLRQTPGWFPTSPKTWSYSEDCSCRACTFLRDTDSPTWGGEGPRDPTDAGNCHVCGDHSSPITDFNGARYCHLCASTHLSRCDECNQYYTGRGRARLGRRCNDCLEAAGYWYCDARCSAWFSPDRDTCPCGGVHRYDYTLPQDQLNFMVATSQKLVKSTTPFLGLELEVEAQEEPATKASGARYIRDTIGDWAYPVHDGSLRGDRAGGVGGDYGFEIVTHPITFEWFNENWDLIKGVLNGLADRGFRSWEGQRCGMHVHISRAPMSEAHQLRFIKFYYGHPMLAMCVGQRGAADRNLSRFSPFDKESHARLIDKVRHFRNPGIDGHYAAINGTKRHTLECRWFRGTLMPASFRKNVEFIHAGWAFTKEYGNTSANEMNFIKWLRESPQRTNYATLLHFIEDNYITKGREA